MSTLVLKQLSPRRPTVSRRYELTEPSLGGRLAAGLRGGVGGVRHAPSADPRARFAARAQTIHTPCSQATRALRVRAGGCPAEGFARAAEGRRDRTAVAACTL